VAATRAETAHGDGRPFAKTALGGDKRGASRGDCAWQSQTFVTTTRAVADRCGTAFVPLRERIRWPTQASKM
jgi:hypothetical protein